MMAYPGYTIKTIEDELSWRVVQIMMDFWPNELPVFHRLTRIETILAKAHGYKLKGQAETKRAIPEQTQESDDRLIGELVAGGFL